MTWNRDVNAAINMVTLLLEAQKRGGHRVRVFQRLSNKVALTAAVTSSTTTEAGVKRKRSQRVMEADDMTSNECERRTEASQNLITRS